MISYFRHAWQNKKYENFVFISRFKTGKCATQKLLKKYALLVYEHLHIIL